jgi:predicted transcriptional regulator
VINLSEGALSREKVCFQIQEFLLSKSANFMQIVEICDVDKATVSKYLSELVDEGKIVLKPKRKQGIDKYALSNKGKDTIILLLEKQKIKTQIDQMTPQKFQEFKKLLNFVVKSKDGEEFLLRFPEVDHPGKIKKFKNVGTKILLQD